MKTILLLGAGPEQAIAIQEAKKLNYSVIACDQNPKAKGFNYADISLVLDINDIEAVNEVATKYSVDGIFCHAVEIPHVVSEVASRMGLPGISPQIARRATNKIERIIHLHNNQIPCASFEIVKNKNELIEKAEKIKFPLILKPVDCAGARGVQLVDCFDNLKKAYQEAIQYSKEEQVLLEEVLCGPEVSTESVVYKGKIHTFALADRNYTNAEKFKPFFIEDGINYPSELSKELQEEIYSLVEKTISVLQIEFGAAKGDIIIDKGTPKIIEMAARTSGGWFGAGSIPAATGCNMLKPLLQMSVGDDPDLDALNATRNLGCAQRYIIPTDSGVLEAINGCEDALMMPGVVMSELFLPEIGATINNATSHADRFGQIICTAKTRSESIELCEAAISKIEIKIT